MNSEQNLKQIMSEELQKLIEEKKELISNIEAKEKQIELLFSICEKIFKIYN